MALANLLLSLIVFAVIARLFVVALGFSQQPRGSQAAAQARGGVVCLALFFRLSRLLTWRRARARSTHPHRRSGRRRISRSFRPSRRARRRRRPSAVKRTPKCGEVRRPTAKRRSSVASSRCSSRRASASLIRALAIPECALMPSAHRRYLAAQNTATESPAQTAQ